MTFYVAPIVEGQTEAGCIERLLQRVWTELLECPERLQVLAPSRGQRDALLRPAGVELASKIEEAYVKLSGRLRRDSSARGMVLLLLDAENDCPKELAPHLLERARHSRSDAKIACVLAKRMFENWLVAGASTLGGVNGLPDPLPIPDKPEDCSGAAWLQQQLRTKRQTRRYKKTVDAAEFVRAMSLTDCRDRSSSFRKLCRDLQAASDPGAETAP